MGVEDREGRTGPEHSKTGVGRGDSRPLAWVPGLMGTQEERPAWGSVIILSHRNGRGQSVLGRWRGAGA